MRLRRILAFAVFFALQLSAGAQTLPANSGLSPKAAAELLDLVNIAFNGKRQDYGFQETDNLSQIVLGQLFAFYFIPEKNMAALKACSNVNQMIENGLLNKETKSILFVGNRPACLVEFYKAADGFHVGGLSATSILSKIDVIIKQSISPVILTSYVKGVWYYTDGDDGYQFLNLLDNVTQVGLGKSTATRKDVSLFLSEIDASARAGGILK